MIQGLNIAPEMTAEEVRETLGLTPHPEGGAYRETWRDAGEPGRRGAASAILFLLAAGEESAWHRVDAAELWLFHAGAPLELRIGEAAATRLLRLGDGIGNLQAVVPAGAWQAARPLGTWSLVSCIVAPAFEFAGFELGTPEWER